MVYSHCFSFWGNLDFPEFFQKSFITSTTGLHKPTLLEKSEDGSNQISNGYLICFTFTPYSFFSFFIKNGPTPASFSFIFGLFKQTLKFLQQIYVKKCPSSIWCQDSNPRPLEHESLPITTRPGIPPNYSP